MSADRPTGSIRYDNSGRVVLVSGGAGGIGKAICETFSRSGATVLSLDQKKPVGTDGRIRFIRGDVSSEQDCRSVVELAMDTCGGLDVLVNNAAVQPPESYVPLDELPADLWQRMVAVNLSGYTYLAKHAIAAMKRQRSGVVVNIASAHAHRTARQVPAYGPIKAANLMQARQWGVEFARDGIRVVSVSPGTIDTPMVRASLAEQGGETELANRHPLGRIGRSEEVAAAVLWLASGDASFVTATDLEVDGGLGAFAAFAAPYAMPY